MPQHIIFFNEGTFPHALDVLCTFIPQVVAVTLGGNLPNNQASTTGGGVGNGNGGVGNGGVVSEGGMGEGGGVADVLRRAVRFRVHYRSWSRRWDEWVEPSM